MKSVIPNNLLKSIAILLAITFINQTSIAHSQADFNRDGIVDFSDLATLTGQWLVVDANKAGFLVAASNASEESKRRADYICDGTADEVEIQAAINALPSTGGKICLSEGTFNTTAKISIPDKTWLQGCGPSTVIDCGTLGDYILENVDITTGNKQIMITDLNLDGSNQTDGSSVIYLENVEDFYISNISITGGITGEHGIYLVSSSFGRIENVVIKQVEVHSIKIELECNDILIDNIISSDPNLDHIHIGQKEIECDNNERIIINNVTGNGGRYGFYIDHANDVIVSNSNINNTSLHGFTVGETIATRITLSNSHFNTCTTPEKDLCFVHPHTSNLTISNCTFKNATNHGISLEAPGSRNVTITGCEIINSDDCGIRTSGSYVTITNTIIDTTRDGTYPNGIYVGGDHVTINNCTIRNVGDDGIDIHASDININNCIVQNCYGYGFRCTGDRITVSNCSVDQATGSEYSSGLRAWGDGILVNNCIFRDIDILGVKVYEASNVIIRGCLFKDVNDVIYEGHTSNKNIHFMNNIIDGFTDCDTLNIKGENIIVTGNSWSNPPAPLTRLIYIHPTASYVWITNNDFSIIAAPIFIESGATKITTTPNMTP